MTQLYFPASVSVEAFNHNGTVFVKAQNLDEAYTKLSTLVTPKPSDFVDFFANVALPTENNTDEFLFVAEGADSFDEVIDLYVKTLQKSNTELTNHLGEKIMNKKFLIATLSQYYTFGRQGYDLNVDLFMQSRIVELKKRLNFADAAVIQILALLLEPDSALETNYKLSELQSQFPTLSLPQ